MRAQETNLQSTFRLEGVSKRYDGKIALARTDLVLPAGHTSVLIGPSGSGKSTLLRVLIGLLAPDSGSVLFEGDELHPADIAAVRQKMGYVIQEGGLFPHLTARGNVTLVARHIGWPDERIESRLTELAALTHFPSDGLERYPAQLSGGQRQRVSLMRALMLDPHVLLLDEPLGALDPITRNQLQDELREIFRALGKTVVMVTHDLSEAAFFGDHLVLMNEGHIVQQGTAEDLVQRPAGEFVSRFIQAQRRPIESFAEGER